MIFEMASFMAGHGDGVTLETIRKFISLRPTNDLVASFSESEIGLLMKNSVEYNLPTHRFALTRLAAWAQFRPGTAIEKSPDVRVGDVPDV
jgi:hypothetical protein